MPKEFGFDQEEIAGLKAAKGHVNYKTTRRALITKKQWEFRKR